MAADPIISNAAAVVACDAIVDLLDVGTGLGYVNIYDVGGGIPADVDAALSTTSAVLAHVITTSTAFFGAAADDTGKATATAEDFTASTVAVAGTASFFRTFDRDDLAVLQGTCGTSNADMIMNTVTIAGGATVDITAYTVSVPEQA